MKIILRIAINAIAIWLTTLLIPAIQLQGGFVTLLIVSIIFGLVNAFIRPIVKLFSLPVTCLTLGLFTLVINGLMLGLTSWLAGGLMEIQGSWWQELGWVILGAIIISLVSSLLNWFIKDD